MLRAHPAETIAAAHARIAPHIHRTPVLTSRRIDAIVGASVWFKAENFQRVGAFKARGAFNAVLSLSDEAARAGVCTHSSGNHAAALALAARERGIAAHIVMPRTASAIKRAAVAGYGGQIVLCEPTFVAREAAAAEIAARTGAVPVPPFDDDAIIAGQATAAVELIGEVPGLEVVTCPVGGGGLLAGTALASRWLEPGARVIAAEPAGADDAWRSFTSGVRVTEAAPVTIADGLMTVLGKRNFAIMRDCVDEVLTVGEAAIVEAMRLVWMSMKIVIEPSAAVPVAAMLEHRGVFEGRRVGVILSGGNVDLDRLPW
ncbi:MAG TPA: pyridoxal-phosphate dependent enzyme [Caulobacteraceae bacterium]|nr:pyridoxal-phosphate dependent enzyme [Caulobacteraceae bacterium]